MKPRISKEQLLKFVNDSLIWQKKPCSVTYDMIEWAFGFVRKEGLEIALTQLMFPSRTEKDICMEPQYKIIQNVQDWCKDHGFLGYFDHKSDTFLFTGLDPTFDAMKAHNESL
jgi:hypothetical protein